MQEDITITVLIDNAEATGLLSEWGLSVHVQTPKTTALIDFGQSDAFARNARTLGIDLGAVDLAVLSHAHYDHADGMEAFFASNDHAPLHLSEACAENCWSSAGDTTDLHYIGIREGLLERYASRLATHPVDRVTRLAPRLHLVPHARPRADGAGSTKGMFCRLGCCLQPDGFAHEITLACELKDGGLALLSSCSHAGVATILQEAHDAFPDRQVNAFIGGLHLMHASDTEIMDVARCFEHYGVERIWCGHCTGEHAIHLLERRLQDRILSLKPGLEITL